MRVWDFDHVIDDFLRGACVPFEKNIKKGVGGTLFCFLGALLFSVCRRSGSDHLSVGRGQILIIGRKIQMVISDFAANSTIHKAIIFVIIYFFFKKNEKRNTNCVHNNPTWV